MRTSETFNELAAALAKAQGAIENAEKDRENIFLKNRYMTLTAVWDAIRKPLSDNGLSIVQVTEADDGAVMLLTRLMHSSGQYIEATYPVIGSDAKGVNAAQAAGSALTYARRYSLTSMIGVVADEDDDGASATGKQQPKVQTKPAPAQQPKPAAPTGPTWPAAANGNGAKPATRPEWHNVDDAVMWGMDQGAFKAVQHSQNAYNKLKAEAMASANPPKNAKDMFDRWYADVLGRLERAKAATITDAELDGTDMQPAEAGEGDEAPNF
jgi:hypothetical protein